MSTDPSSGLLSSVASDIRTYEGKDPLRPWLQGIKKLRACLPPPLLRQKLPRFLQRCAQTFQADRRYRNDSRYVGVWIQLMDFVEDPKALLRMMERNQIGARRAAFYMAYAIFHEKRKNFEEAEKMYHLGVQNFAEPASELQKAYEQFLYRLDLHRKRKAKTEERREKMVMHVTSIPQREITVCAGNPVGSELSRLEADDAGPSCVELKNLDAKGHRIAKENCNLVREISCSEDCVSNHMELPDGNTPSVVSLDEQLNGALARSIVESNRDDLHDKKTMSCSDDTVVVKFVGSAIVGKSEMEDACHHGLVDPTINMKEAMNAISDMFREPLDIDFKIKRKTNKFYAPIQQVAGFQVFVDDSEDQDCSYNQKESYVTENLINHSSLNHISPKSSHTGKKQLEVFQPKPFGEAFRILADDDKEDDLQTSENKNNSDTGGFAENSRLLISFPEVSVTHKPSCNYEDTIIRRFVGSTIHDEPEVENACHHGLVDPTVNLKEAMDDINNMFGEPIDFVRPSRSNRREKPMVHEKNIQGFSILADDDVGELPKEAHLPTYSLNSSAESDLFEQTICTKEAMAEINAMFGMPMDF